MSVGAMFLLLYQNFIDRRLLLRRKLQNQIHDLINRKIIACTTILQIQSHAIQIILVITLK
jgi:hypothetical protein